mmetsp:Transcript_35677/g.75162  ORF Transcript_35677/g.75162 Transcript_35677/m.75162 type:complete len:302 (-) Transcript_35677:128-1033(-)
MSRQRRLHGHEFKARRRLESSSSNIASSFLVNYSPQRMQSTSFFFVVVVALLLAASLPNTLSFVHHEDARRRIYSPLTKKKTKIGAIASPIDQIKLDFVGSLENAYDLNPKNAASSSFLNLLIQQASPESIYREIIESFDQLGTGKWRIVYVQDYSTSFGFGSLFGDITAGEAEVGNDGSITSNIKCINQSPYQLTVKGTFGTARNNMLIKVNNVQSEQLMQSGGSGGEMNEDNDGLLGDLKGVQLSITQSILEKNWPTLFSGVVVVELAYIDDDLAVFDLDFLARVKGKRICARKEPDFF